MNPSFLHRSAAILAAGVLLLSVVRAQTTPAAPAPRAGVDASAPMVKIDDGTFLRFHDMFLRRAKESPIGLLFLGDSITHGWRSVPEVWKERYWKHHPANFGIGGDMTQHVVWRLENGELDGLNPRVVVLMLGTNNSSTHTAAEIAAADEKIVRLIRTKIPGTKVLLLAVFPRGPRTNADGSLDDGVTRMKVINELNPLLAKLDDGSHVRFLDISAKFLGPDGRISEKIMPDQLHLSPAGYKIWAEAMQPLLAEMMQQE